MWWFVFGLFSFELARTYIDLIIYLYANNSIVAVIITAVTLFLACAIPLVWQLFRLLKWSKNTKKYYSE